MEQQFWAIVDRYTTLRWWFGTPALVVLAIGLVVIVVVGVRLPQRSPLGLGITAALVGGAVALFLPGALLAMRPLPALGIASPPPADLPTATFASIATHYEQSARMAAAATGLLTLGTLGAFGVFGMRRGDPCPTCGRARHPSWQGVCPECQLLEPGFAESPLMHLGDPSASGMHVTQFGAPARTELLDSSGSESTAWLEIIDGPSGIGERRAVGVRLEIGRDPVQCQLVIDEDAVSAHHASILHDHDGYVLRDLQSSNGTFVNGERISQRTLRNDDEIMIGRARLRFSVPPATADSAPTVLIDPAIAPARLVVLNDDRVFPIAQLDLRIGRGKHNDLVLDSPSVSRQHARVRFDGSDYYLIDSNSPNGTWLDEVRVLDKVRLRPDQEIRLGDQRLRFEQDGGGDVLDS